MDKPHELTKPPATMQFGPKLKSWQIQSGNRLNLTEQWESLRGLDMETHQVII